MSIHKDCADALRADYRGYGAGKLCAGHAHELVAAFFGYPDAAAMRAETEYPLRALPGADVLIPDLNLMWKRWDELEVPEDLHNVHNLALRLVGHLRALGHFRGEVWLTEDLKEYIQSDVLQKRFSHYTNELSGEMASTNAYFDELHVDEVDLQVDRDRVTAQVTGTLNGESDPDRGYLGDTISFETVLTLKRIAGRVAYSGPDLDTSGSVVRDDWGYFDEEDA